MVGQWDASQRSGLYQETSVVYTGVDFCIVGLWVLFRPSIEFFVQSAIICRYLLSASSRFGTLSAGSVFLI